MDLSYYKTELKDVIAVDKIITIHYFEFASDYVYKGEMHDFWELLYVDKGEVEIMADTTGYKLEQGDVVFHKPNEFHSVWANGKIAPNIVVISFECDSDSMKYFENKILKLSMDKRNLIASIIREGKNTFENDLGKIYNRLVKRENSVIGSEQLIKLYLQLLLIEILRENIDSMGSIRVSSSTKKKIEGDIVNNIIEFMKLNLEKNYTFDDICLEFGMGKTHLKTVFKEATGQGVMSYYRTLKIEEAKKLIREGKSNFTEIAEKLGYDSVHYFSRSFKNHTNMTPSEYAGSVKAIAKL